MCKKIGWKLALIGGGGKIAGAVLLQLLERKNLGLGEVQLFGRTPCSILDNIKLSDMVCTPGDRAFLINAAESLDSALEGADAVIYNATFGFEDFAEYKSLGIAHGSHILYVAEKIRALCPDAWFLVNTNPPDIPLAAVNKRFKLDKIIGLCNAAVISRNVLAAFLGVDKGEIILCDIGVNHDLWFYDILQNGRPIYDRLREMASGCYDLSRLENRFLDSFPEWRLGFENNLEILRCTGYLPSPVGGSKRFTGLPASGREVGNLMKRPSREDYRRLISSNAGREEIIRVTSRCGGGIPEYIVDVIEAVMTDSGKKHSIQVLNDGALSFFPDDVMLQMTCQLGRERLKRPEIGKLPEFIHGVLASRILQNDMVARALANQDEKLMLQAMLMLPDRVSVSEAVSTVRKNLDVEPAIPVN